MNEQQISESRRPAAVPAAGLAEPLEGVAKQREDERYYYASQWELIRWRFGRHRLALISLWGC
jgi:hypothetical protein